MNESLTLLDFLNIVPFKQEDILFLALHGSRINGTCNENSDYDFVMVVSIDLSNKLPNLGVNKDKSMGFENIDITVYTEDEFHDEIKNNSIKCLESLWLDDKYIWIIKDEFNPNFVLDRKKLRVSISTICTRGAHYAKILWNKENDILKAKKNIIHSMRYSLYGLQILDHGKIVDYKCTNNYYFEIINDKSDDWQHYFDKYLQESKRLGKLFRETVG